MNHNKSEIKIKYFGYSERLYWRSLKKNDKVEFNQGNFTYDGAILFYHPQEKEIALRFLKTRV